jgi:hypothetical protein
MFSAFHACTLNFDASVRREKTRSRFPISYPSSTSIFQLLSLVNITHQRTFIKMDRESVFSLSVLPPEYDNEDTRGQIQAQLEQFILQFRLDNAFIYRSILAVQLIDNS